MNNPIRRGLSFGLTSAVITTLGLLVGLYASSGSRKVMLGGIFTIAIADALSDALGMHLAEESSNKNHWQVWQATLATFATKFLLALSFAIPVLLLTERTAVIVGVIYGMLVLIGLNFYIAKMKKEKGWKIIGEHLLIVIAVIVISYLVGSWIGMYF